jgi:copper oxidase (laccase) domain-containing protein
VHGARVVDVTAPGEHAGAEADAAVTLHEGVVLCILTADCAPISFTSAEGVSGVAHAGWKGLADGVIAATADALRARGATDIEAALGPCIHPSCYEFSPADLDVVATRLGDHVRSTTADGRPALDLPGAVRHALGDAGVRLVEDASACTACDLDDDGRPRWCSHRARAEDARQALVQWCP